MELESGESQSGNRMVGIPDLAVSFYFLTSLEHEAKSFHHSANLLFHFPSINLDHVWAR